MVFDFNNWCRLCAKANANEFDVLYSARLQKFNLKELISKHFSITICDEDRTPKKICANCYEFIENLVKFNESVEKVNQMYLDILSKEENMLNGHNVEIKEEHKIFEQSDLKSSTIIKNEHVDDNNLNKTEIFDINYKIELEKIEKLSSNSNENKEEQYTRKSRRKTKTVSNNNIIDNIVNDGNKDKSLKIKKTKRSSTSRKITEAKVTNGSENGNDLKITKRFECNICNKTFASRRYLDGHTKSFHSERQFECEICHKKFGTEFNLKLHGDVHIPYDQRRSCPYCEKKFTRAALKPHISTVHLGEKPFVCEECGKKFGTKRNLMGHMYTHNTKIIYKCSHCNKGFMNKHCLQVHEDIHSKNIYTCSKCGAQLKTKSTLNIHMSSVHSDIKKYKCDRCGMGFKAYNKLKRHLISHLGLKPYSCQFCDKAFTNTKNCRIHVNKIHANEIAALESIESDVIRITTTIPSLDQLKVIVAQAPLS